MHWFCLTLNSYHNSLSVTGRIAINVVKAIEVALTTTQGIKQKMKCIKQQPTGDLITTVDQVEVVSTPSRYYMYGAYHCILTGGQH